MTTNDKIRQRVAELRGWTALEDARSHGIRKGYMVTPDEEYIDMPPNYPEDLNACREFLRTIADNGDMERYVEYLEQETDAYAYPEEYQRAFVLAVALPIKHCRAFLRLHGIDPDSL